MRTWYGDVAGFKSFFAQLGNLIIGIPIEVGPRILFLSRRDRPEENVFGIVPEMAIDTGEGVWRIYGGHRLWTSPEAMPRSYSLDDKPVNVYATEDEVVIEGNPEPQNCVQKFIRVKQSSDADTLEVVHEVKNICRWSIEFSCWALSVMRREGFAIVPVAPKCIDEKCLLPDRSIALWPYTKLSDERLVLGEKFIFVKQRPDVSKPIKIGVNAHDNWAGYWVNGHLFVKYFEKVANNYPDFGSSVEIYTNDKILELETLGPLRRVDPGNINKHIERWKLVYVGHLEPSEEIIEKALKMLF